jgi:chromosomal replication initiator protein
MSLTSAETWNRLLARARETLPEQTVRTWLDILEPVSIEGHTLTLGAPDQFAVDWVETKHRVALEQAAPVAIGHPITIRLKVTDTRINNAQIDIFVAPPPEEAPHQRQKPRINATLNPRYTFDQFVIGKSNDVAAAAAQGVAQAPGGHYNPLFIWGETGLGKTHLMHGVAHELMARDGNFRITYIGAEKFTNEFVESLQSRTTHEFRRKYRETDLLLVDDVQFLRGKQAVQEEFFHTFNAIYEAGRQVVLTSDRPPKELDGLEARLVSRFAWGMVADVGKPELEHRIAILRKKAHVDHLEFAIPDDVLNFVATHIESSVRELEGSMIKLIAYASLKHRDITVDLAREALRDSIRDADDPYPDAALAAGLPRVTLSTIQQAVAREWGVTTEGLRSKTRTKVLTVPRQVAMHLCRDLLGLQLVEIGNAFGGRDHSTVIHSLERVSAESAADPLFAERVLKVRKQLEGAR